MVTLLLVSAALAPALLLMWYFHSRDRYPEPARVVWATFFLGVCSVFPGALLAQPMDLFVKGSGLTGTLLGGFFTAFFAAAVPEELVKFGVLRFYSMRQSAFDEPMDGLVYGSAAALGFAAAENVMYVVQGGAGTAVLRALTAVPSHALYGAVMGFYLGRWRYEPGPRSSLLAKALLVPMLLHGLYDWPLLAMPAGLPLLFLVPGVLIYGCFTSRRQIRILRAMQGAQAPSPVPESQRPAPWFGRFQVLLGGALLLSTAMALALAIWAWYEAYVQHKADRAAVWGLVMFAVPGLLGIWPFRWGIRKLNAHDKAS